MGKKLLTQKPMIPSAFSNTEAHGILTGNNTCQGIKSYLDDQKASEPFPR